MSLIETRRGRTVLFAALYASEGAPIGFIWWSLPVWLRQRGEGIDRIAAVMALVTAIWAFKFLWAPLVDTLRSDRWGFRRWILASQAVMGAALLPLAWLDAAELTTLTALLLVHALAATTQDVSVDALAIRSVPREELGRINGVMQAGKYAGRALFGGVALLAAETWGWRTVTLGLVACIVASAGLLLLVPETAGLRREAPEAASGRRAAAFGAALRAALGRRVTWIGLVFALVSGAGFEAAGALAGPLLVDVGVPTATIGAWRAGPVLACLLAGTLLGGLLADRWGRIRATGAFLVGFVLMVGAAAAIERLVPVSLGHDGPSRATLLLAALTGMYFFFALFIASSYALLMELTEPAIGATQFSAFMGATNGCEAWATWAGGRIATGVGGRSPGAPPDPPDYASAFLAMGAVSLLGLPLLRLLAKERRSR